MFEMRGEVFCPLVAVYRHIISVSVKSQNHAERMYRRGLASSVHCHSHSFRMHYELGLETRQTPSAYSFTGFTAVASRVAQKEGELDKPSWFTS